MKIIYGTTNKSKINLMKKILMDMDIEVVGISEIIADIPIIQETGSSPLDNAIIKSKSYYEIIKMPVFSCDTGLFIEGLNDDKQPGVHVRNIKGRSLSDEEMIHYYSNIANDFGGTCTAYYQNAICCVTQKGISQSMDSSIASRKFIITKKPHNKRKEGFPLDSISIDQQTGEYFIEIKNKDILDVSLGYRNFFQHILEELSGE